MKLKQFLNEKIFKSAVDKYNKDELILRKLGMPDMKKNSDGTYTINGNKYTIKELKGLGEYRIKKWEKNEDGTINVWADLNKSPKNFPFKIKILYGDVWITNDKNLTSFENFPERVEGSLICIHSKITSFKGCSNYIRDTLNCNYNKITSFKYCPKHIGKSLGVAYNKITSFKYCPKIINGNFVVEGNDIKTLEYCPEKVVGDFEMTNSIYSEFTPNEIKEVCDVGGYIHT